jgi:sodium-dependent dicarboxylate transporter 2/3/5
MPTIDTRTTQISPDEHGMMARIERVMDVWRPRAGFVLAPVAMAVVWLLSSGSTLTTEGRTLSCILAAMAVLFVCESIPLPATALLGAVLAVVLGVRPAGEVLTPFANPIIFLFIGSFMLASAMTLHGLDRRIALAVLSLPWVGRKPWRLLAAMGAVCALVSMWVSNTATTAMMLPIAIGVLGALKGTEPGAEVPRSLAAAMMLMVAYGSSIGGVGTPVGSPPNLIGIAEIARLAHVRIDFFQWMLLAVPMLGCMFIGLLGLLLVLHPTRSSQVPGDVAAFVRQQRQDLGAWKPGEGVTLAAFGVAAGLWMLPGLLSLAVGSAHPAVKFVESRFPESIVALLAALLLFFAPVGRRNGRTEFALDWKTASRIDWGTILLFGGGLSMGGLMFTTGVAKWMGDSLVQTFGAQSLWALTGIGIALAIVLSEATNNTAAATMTVPTLIALAQASGLDPVPPALGACLGASFGFMLPVSTAPNAMVYGTGLVSIPRMIRAGVLFDVLGLLIIWGGLRVLYPLVIRSGGALTG